jgi:hypothetical protein
MVVLIQSAAAQPPAQGTTTSVRSTMNTGGTFLGANKPEQNTKKACSPEGHFGSRAQEEHSLTLTRNSAIDFTQFKRRPAQFLQGPPSHPAALRGSADNPNVLKPEESVTASGLQRSFIIVGLGLAALVCYSLTRRRQAH